METVYYPEYGNQSSTSSLILTWGACRPLLPPPSAPPAFPAGSGAAIPLDPCPRVVEASLLKLPYIKKLPVVDLRGRITQGNKVGMTIWQLRGTLLGVWESFGRQAKSSLRTSQKHNKWSPYFMNRWGFTNRTRRIATSRKLLCNTYPDIIQCPHT